MRELLVPVVVAVDPRRRGEMTCASSDGAPSKCFLPNTCDPCAPQTYKLTQNDLNKVSWLVPTKECPRVGHILAPVQNLTVTLLDPDYVLASLAVASQQFTTSFFVPNNGWGIVKSVRPFKKPTMHLGQTFSVCELFTVGDRFSLAQVDPTLVQAWGRIGPYGAYVGTTPGVPFPKDPTDQVPQAFNIGLQIPAFRVNSLDANDSNTPAFSVAFEIADMVLNNPQQIKFAQRRDGSGRVAEMFP